MKIYSIHKNYPSSKPNQYPRKYLGTVGHFGQFFGVKNSEKGQKMDLKWSKKGKKGLRKVQKYHETFTIGPKFVQ